MKASPQRCSVVISKFLYANSPNNWPESLYRDELRHGGWAVDVGLLGSSVFVADALQQLQPGAGDLWKIVDSDDDQ